MSSSSSSKLRITFHTDGFDHSYRFSYENITVRYLFPSLLILDNKTDVVPYTNMIDKDIENVLNPEFMMSIDFVELMSPMHKTCFMLCGMHFFIFVQENFNQYVVSGDNTNLYMLIYFFFVDYSIIGATYSHIDWAFCTYTAINRIYASCPDIIKLIDQLALKMNVFKNTMNVSSSLSVNLESRKIRMLSAYNNARLSLINSKNGEAMSSNVIDSFLYGVIVYGARDISSAFSLFGGPLSIIQDVDEYVQTNVMTVYERAFYKNIFSIFVNFCNTYKEMIIYNTEKIKSMCEGIRCEYANGLIMCYLELHYFMRVTNNLTQNSIYLLTEKICSCFQLNIPELSLSQWEFGHNRSLQHYMNGIRDTKPMVVPLTPALVQYDNEIFVRIKRHVISHLSMYEDKTIDNIEIENACNELKLIAIFMTHSFDSMHVRTIFISLVFHFICIYIQRINNIYKYAAMMYKTTDKWYKRVYMILGHRDTNFITTIERLRDECSVKELEIQTDMPHDIPIHVCFENAIYAYIYIKSMVEIFFRHTPLNIAEIHKFRIIDFSGMFPNGGAIDSNVRELTSKVLLNSRLEREDPREDQRYVNMTLEKLLLGDFVGYAYRSKKTDGYLIDDLFMMHRDNKRYKKAIAIHGSSI